MKNINSYEYVNSSKDSLKANMNQIIVAENFSRGQD